MNLKALLISEMLELNGLLYGNKYYYLENDINYKILTELEIISLKPLVKREQKSYFCAIDNQKSYQRALEDLAIKKDLHVPLDFNIESYSLLMVYLEKRKKLTNEFSLTVLRENTLLDNKDRILDLIPYEDIEDNKYFLSIHNSDSGWHSLRYGAGVNLENIFTAITAIDKLIKTASSYDLIPKIINLISTLKNDD